MKKTITLAAMLLMGSSFAAFASGPVPVANNTPTVVDYVLPFKDVIIDDAINVTLQEGQEKTMEFIGCDEDVAAISWRIKNGTLYLQSKNGSFNNKVTVKLNVNKLASLTLNGGSIIRSSGHLLSPNLYVYMHEDAVVNIKNAGQIIIVNKDSADIDVQTITGFVKVSK